MINYLSRMTPYFHTNRFALPAAAVSALALSVIFLFSTFTSLHGSSIWYAILLYLVFTFCLGVFLLRIAVNTVQSLVKSQAVIAKTEEKFRFMSDSVPNLVWMSDNLGLITFFNRRWTEYTGLDYEQSIVCPELIHEDERAEMHHQWYRAVAEKTPFDMEYRLRRVDGEYRWHLARALPLYDSSGAITNWFGSCTDIHDQKLKNQELKRVQIALELAQKATRVATWEIDTQTGVITHTPIIEMLFGFDAHIPQRHHEELLAVVHDDDREIVRQAMNSWIAMSRPENGGEENFRIEFRVVWPDQSIHWLSKVASNIRDESGRVAFLRGATFDITDIKTMQDAQQQLTIREEAARESSRLKSEFLAAMSHEIRTPINGVLGMTTFLLETELTAEQFEYADAVRRSGNALLTVINDILDFSKIEAGQLDYEKIPFALATIVDDTRLIALPMIHMKDIDLTFDIAPSVPPAILGDPGRLRQILTNLVSNAIKFTEHGYVKVSIETLPDLGSNSNETKLLFTVSDSGIGIGEDERQHLFQPFMQADNSTTRRYGGTGLGLSISKHLAESMNGQIGFESVVGQGSSFWFTAEFGVTKEVVNVPFRLPNIGVTHRPAGKKRILVVEDVYLNQFIATKALESIGYVAHAVGNGKEAIEALIDGDYDLVLMDCLMPIMDGYEATAKIRLSPLVRNPDIPIIAMTACAMKGDLERCLNAGMNDYLSKPVDADTLAYVVHKWIYMQDFVPSIQPIRVQRKEENEAAPHSP